MTTKPYSRPTITQTDIDQVIEVLESQYLTTGPRVSELEDLFCEMFDAPFASACSNGTSALHLACIALGLGPGDHVIVPSMTFLATANAVRMCGADVIFADVDCETGLMGLDHVIEAEQKASKPIKALFVVHMGGYTADMKTLSDYARSKGWYVVEDACHGLGGTVHGTKVGSCTFSDISTFSLHATKTFTAGEGGIVATRSPDIKARVDLYRNHGLVRNPDDFVTDDHIDADGQAVPWAYEMQELGYNYRITDLQCALAISQMGRLENTRQKRFELAKTYREELAGISDFVKPVEPVPNCDPLLHLFQVRIDFEAIGMTRADFCRALMGHGVGTQVHYIPVHSQPYYVKRYGKQDLSGAGAFYGQVLALPFYNSLESEDISEIVKTIKSLISP